MTNSEEPSAPDNLSSVTSKNSSEPFENTNRGSNSAAKAMIIGSTVNGTNNLNTCSSNINGTGSSGIADDDPGTNPFVRLPGEEETYRRETTDGWLILSNYRMYIRGKTAIYNLPLGLIEQVECRDIFFVHIHCKDARYIRCTFSSNEVATSVLKTLQRAISVPSDITESFAFTFYEKSKQDADIQALLGTDIPEFPTAKERFDAEIKRMQFNVEGPWRISYENVNYELCGSYPQHIIVPCMMDKKKLEEVANFRSAKRIPAVVWRHRRNGAVISRCSQPEVGWFGWRSSADEELVQYIVHACADNRCPPSGLDSQQNSSTRLDENSSGIITIQETPSSISMELVPEAPSSKKLLILDARSYTTAVANRARGGGCECLEYYANCEIQFMNLANIHSIRKSFINMRQLCAMPADQPNWYSQLEGCKWLQHMSGLMKAALMIVSAVENEGRPVMVHCSDGWDRTPQMVSLAEILLDPYYRSIEGFQILVEREWLDFGHKFGDRCGQAMASDDANERCPVFLQWLDCLHQLLRQFPSAFEFNLSFLLKLAQHTYSNLFGTFLCNTAREREKIETSLKTHSVWKFLRAPRNIYKFRNNLYVSCDKVLWPSSEVRDLVLWSHVYLGYENTVPLPTEVVNISQDSSPAPSVAADGENSERLITCGQLKTKTRSYEDLHTPHTEGLQRRQSDPSLKDRVCASPNCECDVSCGNAERMLAKAAEDVSLPATPDPSDTSISFISHVNPRFDAGDDSENDDGEPDSGRSESTVINRFKTELKSIESSTDTLVAETGILPDFINKPACINKTDPGDLKNTDDCKTACATEPYSANGFGEAVTSYRASPSMSEVMMTELNLACRELSVLGEGERLYKSEESNSHNVAEKYHNIQTNEDFLMHSEHAGVVLPTLPNGLGLDPSCALCEVCETSKKLLGTLPDPMSASVPLSVMGNSTSTVCSGMGNAVSWQGSKYSNYNTPMHSRTPSTGIPTTPVGSEEGHILTASRGRHALETVCSSSSSSASSNTGSTLSRSNFDVDGLTTLHDEIQTRVNSIVSTYRNQVDSLRSELQVTRDALMKQVGHKCSHTNIDRADDAVSLADSVCSGEHHSVGRESQHSHSSEFSWEAVEEKDTRPPLWLPDFAVTRCMGCDGKFWLGRRKHHCRSCGKIFCADCSERTMTIPSENIYTPVRVCMSCYHRHNSATMQMPCPGVATMTTSYAAVAGGIASSATSASSLSTNGHSFYYSSSLPSHSGSLDSASSSAPNLRSSSLANGSRFPSTETPLMNGHGDCNGFGNASSTKTKKSVTGDAIDSSNVSNGHED